MADSRTVRARTRNPIAFVGMYFGLASFVPLVILITFLPALVCSVIGLLRARVLPERDGQDAALIGIFMAFVSLAVQGTVAALAGVIGLIG